MKHTQGFPETITKFGKVLHAVGIGEFPYDCKHKDRNPNAMIYETEDGYGWYAMDTPDGQD